MKQELTIRFSKLTDLPFIVDIYNQAISSDCATGDMSPFKVEDRIEWFQKYNNNTYPIYIAEMEIENEQKIVGYCTLSPYRQGRAAMSAVAEISYYLDYSFHKKGIGTALLKHAIADCNRIGIESLLAILLDINVSSVRLLEKFNFEKWGHFPDIINLKNKKCGHLIYGLKVKKNSI